MPNGSKKCLGPSRHSLKTAGPRDDWFCQLFLTFLETCMRLNQLRKTLGRKFMIGLKMIFFNCKFIRIFQPDGCAEPTSAAMCFIHFLISHHLDNIRLMLPTYARGVFICSFLVSRVWNVSVNQKRFLYITSFASTKIILWFRFCNLSWRYVYDEYPTIYFVF